MAQITEDYVSFETAKLLKEKGFDAEGVSEFGGFYVDYYHTEERIGIATESGMLNKTLEDWEYLRPTLQMAMKWLREVHKLYFWIAHKMKQNKGLPWYYGIHNSETGSVVKIGDVVCGSYEVACESAIRYCLENLI